MITIVKTIILILLSLTVVLLAAGCGGGDNDSGPSTTPTSPAIQEGQAPKIKAKTPGQARREKRKEGREARLNLRSATAMTETMVALGQALSKDQGETTTPTALIALLTAAVPGYTVTTRGPAKDKILVLEVKDKIVTITGRERNKHKQTLRFNADKNALVFGD